MSTLNQKFKSENNKSIIIKIIDEVIRSKFQITLNDEFGRIFNDIMDYVFNRFGKKPQDITDDDHIKNLNKICIDEAIKYVSENMHYFPKLKNTSANNKVQVMRDERMLASANDPSLFPSGNDGQSYSQAGLMPYNPTTNAQYPSMAFQQMTQPTQSSQITQSSQMMPQN